MRKRGLMRQAPAIDKDADVLAQPTLLVDDITAHVRTFIEDGAERHPDRRARGAQRPVRHNLSQPACEMQFGHAFSEISRKKL